MKIDKEPGGERREKIERLKIDLEKEGWIEKKMALDRGEPRYKEMGAIEIEVEEFNAELARFMGEADFLNEEPYEARRVELDDKRKDIMKKVSKYASS